MYFLMLDACENPTILRTLYFAIIIRDILFTIIPIAMISIMMINFSKAVIASKEDEQLKSVNLIPKRIMYAIIVFLIPWVVHAFMKILDAFNVKLGGDYLLCIHNAETADFTVFDEMEAEEERREREEQERNGDGQDSNTVIDSTENSSRTNSGPLITGDKADNLADEMLRIAKQRIGSDNSTGDYGTPGLPWCAMFATWVMKKTEVNGINLYNDIIQKEYNDTNRAGAGCTMYLFENSSNLRFYYSKYYAENVKKGRSEDAKYIPKKGDIVYFYWRHNHNGDTWNGEITSTCPMEISHIGIVDYVEGNIVHTIEGNNSNKVGEMQYDINGTSKWSGADIIGYGSWYSDENNSSDASEGIYSSDSVIDVQNSIEYYIKKKNYDISLLYYNLNSGYTYKYNEDINYYGASTIKTLDILYYYMNGKPSNVSTADLEAAIKVSDNEAHKRNVKAFGLDNYRKYGEKLGVDKAIMDTVNAENNKFGETNVETQLIYLRQLYELIKNMDNSSPPKSYFINHKTNCLEYNGSPVIMHKYGLGGKDDNLKIDNTEYFHDVGIVLDTNNPYIVIILTKGALEDANCANGGKAITELSKLVHDLHKRVRRSGGIRNEEY